MGALAKILDPRKIDLGTKGRRLYAEMVDAERAWLRAAAGAGAAVWSIGVPRDEGGVVCTVACKLGPPMPGTDRRALVLADDLTALPAMDEVAETRDAFRDYLRSQARPDQESLGDRSTELPAVLLPSGERRPVPTTAHELARLSAQGLRDCVGVRVYASWAHRAGVLGLDDVRHLLLSRIDATAEARDNAVRHHQQGRADACDLRIAHLRTALRELDRAIDGLAPAPDHDTVARLGSGVQVKMAAHWHDAPATKFGSTSITVLPGVAAVEAGAARKEHRPHPKAGELVQRIPVHGFADIGIYRVPRGS